MPATTVGKGRMGGAISAEAPTLDLIADNDDENNTGSPSAISYGAAPAAAMTFTLSYGLGDDTDLEASAEGALYFFILPLPTGGSIGLRQHIDAGDNFDLGLAFRLGRVSSSAELTTSDGMGSSSTTESSASATYGSFQAVVQSKRGFVRPLLAVNFMPARIERDPSDADPFKFRGVASSVTGGLMFVGKGALFGPYLTATNFYSDQFNNSGWFVSGGLMFAVRPDRNREPQIPAAPPMQPGPPQPEPYYGPPPPPPGPYDGPPPPPPGPAPGPGPTPAPAPEGAPAPAPAPAPTPTATP